MATQYFAERGIVCISRIDLATLNLLAKSTSATIQRSLQFLPTIHSSIHHSPSNENPTTSSSPSFSSSPSSSDHPDSHKILPATQVLGTCRSYAVKTIGAQTYHVFDGCDDVATLVLRGGSSSLLGEVRYKEN